MLGVAFPVAGADSHDHQHEVAPTKLELNQGKKWETDAPLRHAMATMRADFAGKLHAIHMRSLGREDYAALGKSIESQVGIIVSQCKLEPRADAMLHVSIAELMAAADVLQDKVAGQSAGAAHRAVVALNNYGKYFAHPGWRAIR
jgi:hypothetical protein